MRFRSVGGSPQAASASTSAGALDSQLLAEAAAAAAATAASGNKASAGLSPFQLHYDFSALSEQGTHKRVGDT
jgi:hypothetical protein